MGMRAEGTYTMSSSSVTIQLDWNENTFGTKKKATVDFRCTRSKSEMLECRDDDGGDVPFRKLQ
jgi:hypothetical protein